jgi:hypothetical protein
MRLLTLLVLAVVTLGPLPAWAQAIKLGAVVGASEDRGDLPGEDGLGT